MWFNSEFYQMADELAAELARVKERWGEENGRRRVPVTLFKSVTFTTGAATRVVHLRVDARYPHPWPIYVVPGPQTIRPQARPLLRDEATCL